MSADIWTFLIKYVHTFELISHRGEIYKFVLGAVLDAIGVPRANIDFVKESDHHLTRENLFINLRMWALSTQADSLDTGDDIKYTPMLSPMICPPMEVLNKEIHDVDFEFGGVDQVAGALLCFPAVVLWLTPLEAWTLSFRR